MVADDFEGEINRFLSLNQLSSMFRKSLSRLVCVLVRIFELWYHRHMFQVEYQRGVVAFAGS